MNATETLTRTLVPSPVGELQVITSDRGVVAILWPDDERWTFDCQDGTNEIAAAVAVQLEEFFNGERTNFEVPFDLRGTEFQQMVWTSLAEIPYGETVSYAQQANRLGRPSSVRAFASANGKNPVSVILPCHRVIGSNGKLTGYAGGLDAKRWLLDLEQGSNRLL